jgi:very-short-patch-repair endonuclease
MAIKIGNLLFINDKLYTLRDIKCSRRTGICNNMECIKCYKNSVAANEKDLAFLPENNIHPRLIAKRSHKKFKFKCNICGHILEISPDSIYTNKSCKYCAHQDLCTLDICTFCLNNSCASQEKSKYWSKQNKISPRNVFKSSNTKYWFDCPDCPHTFDITPQSIQHGNWCRYCSHQDLCTLDICTFCLNNSCASQEKSKYWSKQNKISPRMVFKSSNNVKYWFDCPDCLHTFDITPQSIQSGHFCRYCEHQDLCDNDNCTFCNNIAFIVHEKSKYWSPKNILKPRQVFLNDNRKYYFNCDKCPNELYISLNNVNNGTWCGFCKKKTELLLMDFLKLNYTSVISQYTTEDYKNNETDKNMFFDFYLPEFKLIIELDGKQHFKKVSNWADPKITMSHDILKMKQLYKNGLSIIRILQDEVWNDKIDWKKLLLENIKLYDKPEIILIANDQNIYNEHMEKYNILLNAD